MRSTTGKHFVALDHIRALAAFIVFSWHFMHYTNGYPVRFEFVPAIFPLAIFDEGHTGVALFMVLSGYLFAKLLDGKRVRYLPFLWNRALRLLPLLVFVFIIEGGRTHLRGERVVDYAQSLLKGFIYPTWPNGGWSITAEFHFYLLLPLLLYLVRRSIVLPLAVVLCAVAFRGYLHLLNGEVQTLAYWTIIGRIDQFTMGIIAFHLSSKLIPYRRLLPLAGLAFCIFWWWFDQRGGFLQLPTYPSPSRLWIIIPTIEAVAYAALIVWYDTATISINSLLSRVAQRFGEYSYSIYLLHFFFVFEASRFINEHVMNISNFYIALCWSALAFVLMLIPAYLSFRLIEAPFLRLRRNYVQP